jgi:hypothetical protein
MREMPAGRPDAGDGQKASKVSGKPPRNGAVRALAKTVRLRDKGHRKFVSQQACLVTDTESAMSSPSRCVGSTTASFIAR